LKRPQNILLNDCGQGKFFPFLEYNKWGRVVPFLPKLPRKGAVRDAVVACGFSGKYRIITDWKQLVASFFIAVCAFGLPKPCNPDTVSFAGRCFVVPLPRERTRFMDASGFAYS
jgi:hypothetical protein